MLLNALTLPDTVPTVSESDLRDVSDAKAEALNAWDVRLESIFGENKITGSDCVRSEPRWKKAFCVLSQG